jgi:hypothetical protein
MINEELLDEIKEFCKLNELQTKDIVNKALRSGFTTLKFGETPISSKKLNKPVEVIKTVEVIKEVPVEKIVEVIREVPVDKIVEVPVEKSVNINVDE